MIRSHFDCLSSVVGSLMRLRLPSACSACSACSTCSACSARHACFSAASPARGFRHDVLLCSCFGIHFPTFSWFAVVLGGGGEWANGRGVILPRLGYRTVNIASQMGLLDAGSEKVGEGKGRRRSAEGGVLDRICVEAIAVRMEEVCMQLHGRLLVWSLLHD
ncbi:hypothetical protein IWX90DRAFT_439483 [Phyllosticta citrichinensis]|uniref:Uncharacterized protein n=1 Tax=Phyllosticta citrichinensis TaxID=1130410 RepID=A0ABR1XPJ1_9PEZI